MLRFIDNQVDAAGNSVPGAYRLTDAEVAKAQIHAAGDAQLSQVAAADKRMAADLGAGFGYNSADFEAIR
jgi:hypothetical protein